MVDCRWCGFQQKEDMDSGMRGTEDVESMAAAEAILVVISMGDLSLIELYFFHHNPVGHPWIGENGVAPDRALDPAVLSHLKQFSVMNKLKNMALRVCSLMT
ncbi:Calcium-dependent protein kinase 26 [Camellia lanceoleosa]|uniref:Calcium-dependent protein kinase 26 n=1 Tax=Camellia lanceoleosa TaxID=1840588 RepID=A0ACC0FUH7_9ERIC|nr:Calcium-dependent protein kinase 26 [Camellia lanceoleosa]